MKTCRIRWTALCLTRSDFTLRIRDRESMLIRRSQIIGGYRRKGLWVCESCGEDIAIERLKARPVTRHCIRCKTRIEAHEKLTET
jgi:DnaK suppressor protein